MYTVYGAAIHTYDFCCKELQNRHQQFLGDFQEFVNG